MGNASFIVAVVFSGVASVGGLLGLVPRVVCFFGGGGFKFCPPPPEPTSEPTPVPVPTVSPQPSQVVPTTDPANTNAPTFCGDVNPQEVAVSLFLNDVNSGFDVTDSTFQGSVAVTVETTINQGNFTGVDCQVFVRISNVAVEEVTVINDSGGQNILASRSRNDQGGRRLQSQQSGIIIVLTGVVQSAATANFLASPQTEQVFNNQVETMLSASLASPVEIVGASIGEVQECPNEPLVPAESTFIVTSRNPTSALSQQDIDDLERECALQYALLNAQQGSCNQAFLNVMSCEIALLEETILGGEGARRLSGITTGGDTLKQQKHRKLSFNSGLRFSLSGTGYAGRRPGEESDFFNGFRRRLQPTENKEVSVSFLYSSKDLWPTERSKQLSLPTHNFLGARRHLQGGDVCVCPIEDDQQDLAVDFETYIQTLNETVPVLAARDAEEVEEQVCSGIEFFEIDLLVAVEGSDAAALEAEVVLQIEQLLKEQLNVLSLDNCPETFVFVDDVTLNVNSPSTGDGAGNLVQRPRSGLFATYNGRCATGTFGTTRSCSDSIFSSGFRRNLRSSQKSKPNNHWGLSIEVQWDGDSLPHRYRRLGRALQDSDFPCYCRVGVQAGGEIDVVEYNMLLEQELPDYLDPAEVTLAEVFESDTFPPTILETTVEPTIMPTATPTIMPTSEPTPEPSPFPTPPPSSRPTTLQPSPFPTPQPSSRPTTLQPSTMAPTGTPVRRIVDFGNNCVTSAGNGNSLTLETCVAGNQAQQWEVVFSTSQLRQTGGVIQLCIEPSGFSILGAACRTGATIGVQQFNIPATDTASQIQQSTQLMGCLTSPGTTRSAITNSMCSGLSNQMFTLSSNLG